MNDNEARKVLGRNIKSLLEERGLSQMELASMLSVSQSTVSDWIKGNTSPRMDKIDRMADLFGVSRADFLVDIQPPEWAVKGMQQRLMAYFEKLNSLGKETAIQRLEELSEMDKYKK